MGSDGGSIQITDPTTYEFQDVYLANVYNHSDAAAKTDIRAVESATNSILRLNPVTYRFTNQSGARSSTASDGRQTGFLAQEVMQVLPNSVAVTDDEKYLVNYISIIPVLVGAIQEQNARIDALEKEIKALKN